MSPVFFQQTIITQKEKPGFRVRGRCVFSILFWIGTGLTEGERVHQKLTEIWGTINVPIILCIIYDRRAFVQLINFECSGKVRCIVKGNLSSVTLPPKLVVFFYLHFYSSRFHIRLIRDTYVIRPFNNILFQTTKGSPYTIGIFCNRKILPRPV